MLHHLVFAMGIARILLGIVDLLLFDAVGCAIPLTIFVDTTTDTCGLQRSEPDTAAARDYP